jgi:hypothetical protein
MVMILFGLAILFSFVVAYLSARTWPVIHVLLVAGVFLASMVFVVLASATLKTQAVWRDRYNRLDQQLKAELDKTQRMLHGDPGATQLATDSILGLRGAIERATLDRGRVWRNVKPAGLRDNQITLDMGQFGDTYSAQVGSEEAEEDVAPQPQPAAPGPASRHGITQNMMVYIFEESAVRELGEGAQGEVRLGALFPSSDLPQRDTQGRCRLPSAYVGQFQVTAVAENSVTVMPTLPLDQDQVERIRQAGGKSWTLYEIMPIDCHEAFAGFSAEQVKAMLPRDVAGILEKDGRDQRDQRDQRDKYEELIDQYVRDGTPAQQGDMEERTWTGVKFTKPYSVDVDVEGDAAGAPRMVDRNFDAGGLAISPLLRQGSPTQFAPGDTALVDSQTARRLIQQELCEPDGEASIYRRPLRDYEYFYHALALRLEELDDERALVKRQTQAVSDAHQKADRQIQARQDEKQKLQEDLRLFLKDAAEVRKVLAALEAQYETRRQRLSQLYRENKRLAAELASLENQLHLLNGGNGDGILP